MASSVTTDERHPLTAERIVTAALDLIDQDGLDAFSMRRLGKALGFEAMAIYKHVNDKEALLDLIVARLFGDVRLPDADDPWETRLRHLADEQRRVALAHPHLFQRMFTGPPPHDDVTAVIEAIVSAISDALAREAADHAVGEKFWLYVSTTSGALLAETNAANGSDPFSGIAGADLAQCPALTEFGVAIASCNYEQVYRDCLDNIVAVLSRPQSSAIA